ncbi:MAG: alpha/beta hydrolase [Nitrospinales bacterium]
MSSVFDLPEFNGNLFFPRPDLLPPPPGKDEIYVEVEAGVRVHLRRYPNPSAGFSLLYFHGNGEIVSDYDALEKPMAGLGAELTVCDYRGYGKSDGTPTLRKVMRDAELIYRHLQDNGKLLAEVCVMGRSLGSASAIELCAGREEIGACVIESGYADPIPLVERRGLKIHAITPEEDALFNNSRKIAAVTCPLLIMHGKEDNLIYPHEAELNYRQAGSKIKTLKLLDGVGHNDILFAREYFPSLKRFFDATVAMAGG